MPIHIVRNDITKMNVDAIVNAANETLLGGGGVDGAIHRAAGPGLLAECRKLGGCETGHAKITGAYDLPCKYVIHTVGPVWHGGGNGERELLSSCYRESLLLAKEKKCETLAFPLISSGVYGYPKDQALRVAVDTISEYLAENDMTVYVVVFDKSAYRISEKLFAGIERYIDDHYVGTHTDPEYERIRRMNAIRSYCTPAASFSEDTAPLIAPAASLFEDISPSIAPPAHRKLFSASKPRSLDDALKTLDESFSEMLLRLIDERGMTDAECYKKANIDRKLFSKIRGDKLYKPSKPTAIAFAIALELPLDETKDMLMKAGFALSHSNKFDVIIEYFIENGNYNIFEINEALFAFDQSLLGA